MFLRNLIIVATSYENKIKTKLDRKKWERKMENEKLYRYTDRTWCLHQLKTELHACIASCSNKIKTKWKEKYIFMHIHLEEALRQYCPWRKKEEQVTCSWVRHDSCIYATWLTHMCAMIHSMPQLWTSIYILRRRHENILGVFHGSCVTCPSFIWGLSWESFILSRTLLQSLYKDETCTKIF